MGSGSFASSAARPAKLTRLGRDLVALRLDPGVLGGSASGGSSPPRSVPAMISSGARSSGTKPDFMPK